MFGGMLTLIGTSTNILASDVSERLLGQPFSMFEFTKLGIIVLLVGSIYLLTVGHRLLPERVPVEEDYVQDYAIEEYLTEVVVDEDSPLIGTTVADAIDHVEFDADILQVVRDDEEFIEPIGQKTLRSGDMLRLRANRPTVQQLVDRGTLTLAGSPETADDLEPEAVPDRTLVEIVVPGARSSSASRSRVRRFASATTRPYSPSAAGARRFGATWTNAGSAWATRC